MVLLAEKWDEIAVLVRGAWEAVEEENRGCGLGARFAVEDAYSICGNVVGCCACHYECCLDLWS